MDVKSAVCRTIDVRQDAIERVGREIFAAPELGYKEQRTARIVADWFAQLGLRSEAGLGLTGVKAVVEGGASGPTVAILGELDSLLSWEHPQHDPGTGAAHACGHNAQIAAMLGAAFGLIDSGIMPSLAGRVAFIAVPAEEFVEIEERLQLRSEGRIEFAITDYEAVAVTPAKAMAMTVIDLLGEGGRKARQVLDQFEPRFTKTAYLEFVRSLAGTQVFDYLAQ